MQVLKMDVRDRHQQREFTPRKIAVRALFVIYHVIALYYLVWLLRHINRENLSVFIPFYIAEVICLISLSLSILIIWRRRFNRPQAMPDLSGAPEVDIFITACGEPIEIVRETIENASKIRYPHKKVYVLDDGASPEVREAAEAFGCRYLSRPVKEDRKAGNLNYGLENSSGEFILALDSDQVASPEILERMMGYFKLDHVAFVQSAQDFCVSENDPFGNRETVFYQVEQTGKDAFNSAFSCGSAVVYRRSALKDIGGFSTWNLVEDVHTSLLLHDKG
ncbi:MAG TPA: cellulose synthase catalytic subunit, partial [Candidatus Omnitrophota bacterium]|nr:cellulose synthase catalytic subunit [Candidatus Omnitrophota bacterium]